MRLTTDPSGRPHAIDLKYISLYIEAASSITLRTYIVKVGVRLPERSKTVVDLGGLESLQPPSGKIYSPRKPPIVL